ncbi:phage tail sheath family protein [Mesobacillus thioparans]|uniref:phage tail sheath family protein n=1 Tax=Mesobacillus thioparans TaxID=370439 RepID=UPI0039F03DB1
MENYMHGISLKENPTSVPQPTESLSSVTVVIGTAPINLAENIEEAINNPILVRSFDEARRKLGYSDDWEKYTLCEAMDAYFRKFKVGPLVFINVLGLDHKESGLSHTVGIVNRQAKIDEEGIILDSLQVKSVDGVSTYVEGIDYVVDFDLDGKPIVTVLSAGNIKDAEVLVEYEKLNPGSVSTLDIIGGYNSVTNRFEGAELVRIVYQKLGLVPSIILAPKFSRSSEVGSVLVAKSTKINGSFNATNLLDVAGNTKEEAIENKGLNNYDDKSSIVCWPKTQILDKTYHYSTILAAAMVKRDTENDDVPYKSPSNQRISINAMINDDGQEVFLDQLEGNVLNSKGIVTAINMNGWRTWGNNTAAYRSDVPGVMDPKERFIAVRRMFDWWGNSFIVNYFDKVDEPGNYRLIESLVDGENIRANGLQARNQIAGATIEFRQEDNPVEQILNGKIQFIQKIGFFTPAEHIENILEFDPTILTSSLFGGEE